jgi:membrane-anchored protein YejM (alkaline phosphatase superfamily)
LFGAAYRLGLWEPHSRDSGAEMTNKLIKQEIVDVDGPLFLMVNYMEPHTPYQPPQESRRFTDQEEIDFVNDALEDVGKGKWTDSDALSEAAMNCYDSELRYLDSQIADLKKFLDKELERETVYVIVGDHGENLGEFGMYNHMFGIWESLAHVPMIIAGSDIENMEFTEGFSLRRIFDILINQDFSNPSKYSEEELYSEFKGSENFLIKYADDRNFEDIAEENRTILERSAKALIRPQETLAVSYSTGDVNFYSPGSRIIEKELEVDDSLRGEILEKLKRFKR